MNKNIFDFLGITRWHELGIKGQGITIASREKMTEHGSNVYDILKQICPEANIRIGVDYMKDDDWDIYTTSLSFTSDKNPKNQKRIKELNEKGKMLFCAVGNTGDETCRPTAKGGMLSVGACKLVNGNPQLANYSSRCEHLDFVSFSNLYTAYSGNKAVNGTSFSSPTHGGLCGLINCYFLNRKNKRLSYEEQMSYMIDNCIDMGEAGRDNNYGYGLLILPELEENMEIKLRINNKLAHVNGEEVMLDTEPIIHCNRTMVPIRFIAETFGCKVEWNEKEREVTIVK